MFIYFCVLETSKHTPSNTSELWTYLRDLQKCKFKIPLPTSSKTERAKYSDLFQKFHDVIQMSDIDAIAGALWSEIYYVLFLQ